MPIDSYKPPPRIPGVLYETKPVYVRGVAVLEILVLSGILFLIDHSFQNALDTILLIFFVFFLVRGLFKLFKGNEPIFVRVTPTDVTVKFLKGNLIDHDNLQNYALLIEIMRPRTSQNAYRYQITLVRASPCPPENSIPPKPTSFKANGYEVSLSIDLKLPSPEKFIIPENSKKGPDAFISIDLRLPLAKNFMTPENLKEWIDAFQRQISSPLPILFESDQLKRDFESGIYQCPYPKKS